MNMEQNNVESEVTTQSQQVDQQELGSIAAVASDTSSLSTLVTALQAADLVETLQGVGPFTVFAPTNDAFAALPEGTLDSLLLPENVDQLKSVLTYHVVSGKVLAKDLSDGQQITTVQGETITVSITDGDVYLVDAGGNRVMVETADVDADNGVVHVVSGVLLPS
ncbi:fasciclin domain-containing protein [Candidatus Saccharibacteria bacterium]|nr:fasciclin domain-containing protein [Candidatus Saccharibacteria bacterium]